MPWNYGIADLGQFSINQVQICPTHGAGLDSHSNLAGSRQGIRPRFEEQRCTSGVKDHRVHDIGCSISAGFGRFIGESRYALAGVPEFQMAALADLIQGRARLHQVLRVPGVDCFEHLLSHHPQTASERRK